MRLEAKQRALALMGALAVVLFASPIRATAAAATDDAGKKKADEACAVCHGPAGDKPTTPQTPRLGGQEYGYLVQALNDYRKGTRDNPLMSAIAKPLTDKEIHELAGYFSRQHGLMTKR